MNFTRANLSYACLIDADFTGATFATNTNLYYASFCRTIMPDGAVNNSGCASGTACCSVCNTGFKGCGTACIANDQCCTNGSVGCAQGQTCCSGICQECCGSDTSTCPAVPPGATCKARSCQNGTCGLVNAPNGEPDNNCDSPRFCQNGVCVGCVTPATCPPAPICKVATCNDGECGTANQENGAACSLSGGGEGVCSNAECVQCISPGTCPAPSICKVATCIGNQCGSTNANNGPVPGCPDPGCCNGACCPSGQVCAGSRCCPQQTPDDCGGTCTNTNTDLNNCGGCGRVCSFPHASANCVAGECQLGACNQGFANCDGKPATGCETPLGTDQNCSGCGNICSGGTVCRNFTCVNPCDVCASGCRYTTVQAAVNDFNGPATIRICPGAYGQFTISRDVTLIGAGQGDDPASNTIINGAGGALPSAVFVNLGRSVSLQRMRITGGKIGVNFWGSSLGMTDCTVTGNVNPGGISGGVGVFTDFNSGSAHLTNCTISDNSVIGNGGGIYLDEGASVTLNGGTVTGNMAAGTGNSGGGIYNDRGSVTLSHGASVTGNMPNNCAGFPAVPGCVG